MKTALTTAAAALALLSVLDGSASAQTTSPPFGYFVWHGPGEYFPWAPAAGSVPLVDYLVTTPGWSPPVKIGCYFTRARMNNAWRRVEVCY